MLATVLVAALACSGQDGGSPPPLDDPGFLQRSTAEVLAALDAGAGIRLPAPAEVVLLTSDEATARRRRYAEGLGSEVGFTGVMDSMADLMFKGNLLGRYFPDEKAVYVFKDALINQGGQDEGRALEILFPVLAHELVHAYDHQVYGAVPAPEDLESLLDDPSALPSVQALMSLLEGRATYASELACQAVGRRPLPARTVEQVKQARIVDSDGSVGGDGLAAVGNAVGRVKLIQYAWGREFAQAVHAFGGEPFFAEVFEHLPLGMDELMDFNRFLVRWVEEEEAQQEADEGEAAESAGPGTGPAGRS